MQEGGAPVSLRFFFFILLILFSNTLSEEARKEKQIFCVGSEANSCNGWWNSLANRTGASCIIKQIRENPIQMEKFERYFFKFYADDFSRKKIYDSTLSR